MITGGDSREQTATKKVEILPRTHDPARTFEAGLRWFCDRVKEKVMARLDVEPELSDVVDTSKCVRHGRMVWWYCKFS